MSRNPIVMIIYILITYGGMAIFVLRGVRPFLPSEEIGSTHITICCALMISSLGSFMSLLRTNPGKITKSSIKAMEKKYPYDGILFNPADCTSCKMKKIARSKHCGLCKMCVERQDHHCIWINGCVGAKNYRLFLWFLLSHSVMCIDIAFITTFIYVEIIKAQKLMNVRFVNSRTGEVFSATWTLITQYLIGNYPDMMFVLVLCLAMGIALSFFFVYHLSLVVKNETTNESNKVSDLMYNLSKDLDAKKEALDHKPEDKEKIEKDIKELEEKIKQLDKNYYSKGVKNNIMEVLFP